MKRESGAVSGESRTYPMVSTALMAAVTCVLAPVVIPIGVIPISITNFVIFCSLYLLGWRRATVSYVIYLMIGMVGVPVFSGFTGGVGKLAGPTGGYLIGFIPMAVLAGIGIASTNRRLLHILAMAGATLVAYLFGTAWFCIQMNSTLGAALGTCVIPFLPWDLGKILVVSAMGPMLRERLKKAGLPSMKR